jgi:GNAT superfamily N-acetyltransferase
MDDESQHRRHPEHERLCEVARSWFRTSYADLGYVVERRRFGFYRHRTKPPDARLIVVEAMAERDVPAFLADARAYFGELPVEIWVEGRSLDATLKPAFISAGCAQEAENVSLAYVGVRPEAAVCSDLTVELATAETLTDYALTKLKGFANSESDPTAQQLEYELAIRKSEMAGDGRHRIARIAGEPAAIVGYYDRADRSIFNLATRLPFRNRGIAKHLLLVVLADSFDRGCRSVIIGTDPADTPIQLYRRLGFTDEVYWRGAYLLT